MKLFFWGIVVYNLFIGFSFTAIGADPVWTYPTPQGGRDVKDISFYQATDVDEVLPSIEGRPRNVILLIGDGMGYNHVALARHRALGASGRLYMERLPVVGVVRTYSADSLITDSAAAATAMACGVKTDNGRIGTTPDGLAWQSLMQKARSKGFRTGLVATSTITHATPAGFAAHVDSRGQEADIAAQLLANRIDILFGGGRKYWLAAPDGVREDGQNLIDQARAVGYQIAYTAEQMAALKPAPALGLFAEDAMTTFAPEPMLDAMTRTAIALLSAKPKDWFAPAPRFVVMIEGSQIDWAGHANDTDNAVRQTLLFDLAVKEAVAFARRDKKTLVIVTSDHETGGLLLKRDKNNRIAAEWHSKNHTAADVPLYAFGPGAVRFAGTLDNTDIAKRIAELLGFDHFPAPLKMTAAPAHTAAQ